MITTSGVSKNPIVLIPAGGIAGSVSGGVIVGTPQQLTIFPVQLCGFVPLVDCALDECRDFNGKCYFNPVFGSLNVFGSTYENDVNTFFIDDAMRRINLFVIQKKDPILNVWNDKATIGSTAAFPYSTFYPYSHSYGTFYNYGYFSAHKNYCGVQINWGQVLTMQGAGIYRLKVSSPSILPGGTAIDPNPYLSKPNPYPYCLVSEPFELMPWNCDRAHGTAKFEANQSGRIGSITQDGYVFNLCSMTLFDSIRQKGFFGFEKTGYDEIMLETQLGLMDRVRDEAIQKFEWGSKLMPKYIHDRFKSYGLMADSLYVSDYNRNNSDYDLKRKSIAKASGYEPKYYKGNRLSSVKTEFKEGIQGVIKSSSCQTLR